jgi:hypothetical protein
MLFLLKELQIEQMNLSFLSLKHFLAEAQKTEKVVITTDIPKTSTYNKKL